MKKFYKGTLITALICIVFGLGMVAAGAMQGGFQLFLNMVNNNEFAISDGVFPSWYWFDEDVNYEDGEYSFPAEEINSLELDIGASTLEIKYEDTDQYHILMRQAPVGYGECGVDNGVLYLESSIETSGINFGTTKANKITLTIPKDAELKDINLILGAGSCTGKSFCADTITIEIGAGNLELDRLVAKKALDLQVGAGNVEVDEIEAGLLEIECEAGRCFADSIVTTDNIDVTCDAGYVYMGIEGPEKSYNYELDCSLGSIEIAGKGHSGMDFSKKTDNDADKNLTAECNVGSIEIEFED
jgi:hypothetical protein